MISVEGRHLDKKVKGTGVMIPTLPAELFVDTLVENLQFF